MTEHATRTQTAVSTWAEANRCFLDTEEQRLRLLLQRRVLWLRRQWRHDPVQAYQGQVISEVQADWLLTGEDRRAEACFYQEDAEAAKLTRSIAEVESELNRQRQELTEAGTLPALEVLVRLFSLTPFERNVLLLCMAPELDPTIERLYAYVQDDVSRKYATPHLALTLFGSDGTELLEARNSFLPEEPLRRFHLVTLESGMVSAAMHGSSKLGLDERIGNYMRAVNRLDERITDLLGPVRPVLMASPHERLVDQLEDFYRSGVGKDVWPAINLVGPPGAGRQAVARSLCDRLGLQLYVLDTNKLPVSGPESQKMLRLLEREAVLSQFAVYLEISDGTLTDKGAAASLSDVIERLNVFAFVASRQQWQTERETLAVQVSKPDVCAQRVLWEKTLSGLGESLNGHIETIVQQFDFGPRAISTAVASARGHAQLRTNNRNADPSADDLWRACREHAGWQMQELAKHIISCYTWEDIVLPKNTYSQLQEIAAQVIHRPKVYEVWGFGEKLSRGRGISALFAGPSGTGKTMAAEVLANHLKLDLYRIDLAGVVSKYIGETEKNLRKVFDAAEQCGAILFFDEADALFGKRTEVKDSHDRYANIEVNYLLQRMEDYRGLAILATNRKSALDHAFMRRLRFLVEFPFPDANNRRLIWEKAFPPRTPMDGLDYARLARLEIPGGNIRNIALNAAFLAAHDGVPVGIAQIMHSTRREYAKMEKMVMESEFGPYYEMVK